MANRVPIYELHIRPLFRLIDREHMLLFFDLWDYDAIKASASVIHQRLRSGMPPASAGGPWPSELIDMFGRWVSADCPRLSMGRGVNYLLTRAGSSYHLECAVEIPHDSANAWLEIVDKDPARRAYTLYVDPSGGAGGAPTSLTVSDDFDETASLTSVQVSDAAGTHTVSVSVV